MKEIKEQTEEIPLDELKKALSSPVEFNYNLLITLNEISQSLAKLNQNIEKIGQVLVNIGQLTQGLVVNNDSSDEEEDEDLDEDLDEEEDEEEEEDGEEERQEEVKKEPKKEIRGINIPKEFLAKSGNPHKKK